MVKTTINLDTSIYRELVKEAIERYGTTKTLSRLINEKLAKLTRKKKRKANIAERTFGAWKIKETGLEYTKKIREEMETNVERRMHG